MKVVITIAEMKQALEGISHPLGFVPTMGFLHEGHISLVHQAAEENKTVAASIFVNPTQFGPSEDLKAYPRNTERDLKLLAEAGTGIVFMPDSAEIYPEGFDSWLNVGTLTSPLEGASRPTHFRGVTTVIAKLFNIVEPDNTYFGQKDAQQALVIQKMTKDLNMNLNVIILPTVREPDGLAMSSRNIYLNPAERGAATVLFRASKLAEQMHSRGEPDARKIRAAMTDLIKKEPLAQIDYVSVADAITLNELQKLNTPALVSMAVRIGKTRLIDNTVLR
ncbi:pantoate--beta-alanine ligase [Chloroflexota bacterium]